MVPLAALVLFLFLEAFLLLMAAVPGGWGWGVFWFEVATAVIGVLATRRYKDSWIREGMRAGNGIVTLQRMLQEGAWVVAGGILLILPGFLTDFLGAILLTAPWLRRALRNLRRAPYAPPPRDAPPKGERHIVEGEVIPRSDRERKRD